jgi:hypothetical protein
MGPLLMLSSIPICAIYVPDNQLLVLAVSGGKTGRGDGPENVCWGALLGTGAAMLLVGLPVLMLGANQRSKYKVWLQDTPGVRYRVKYGEGITLLPIHGGIALGWHTEF